MWPLKNRRTSFLLAVASLFFLDSSSTAVAQAWLPPQGEAWISLGYGNAFTTKHYWGVIDPGEVDGGRIRAQALGLQLGYAATDRFTLSVGIPFVSNKYSCSPVAARTDYNCSPHPFSNADDGSYHATFQDFRLNVAYQLFAGEVSVAPFATAVIPSHGYVYFAHAAYGKDLHQYLLGFSAGARLDRVLPGSYFQASYDYAFVEPVLGINLNRSDFSIELGYFMSFLTPSLSVRFLGTGYYTHGGVAVHSPFDLLDMPDGPNLFLHHDQISKSRAVTVGGGFSYLLTGSTEVYASYLRSVYGRDSLKIDQGVSFGVSWSFSPQQILREYFSPKAVNPPAGGP